MTGRGIRLAVLSALLSLLPGFTALAQSYDDHRRTCLGNGIVRLSALVASCETVLAAGRETPPTLAETEARTVTARLVLAEQAAMLPNYDSALQANPSDQFSMVGRCQTRALLGRLSDALADCDAALSLRKNDAWAFETRGFVRLLQGEVDLALADYQAAVRFAPLMAEALFGRGVARRLKGDSSGGDADIAAARKVFPEVVQGMARIGVRL